ncbi:urease accessory protein UreF [Paenibacillus sp. SN-8-1]|uniref:urease accessory protein UreF n=1 Tax=Paenibacillus sp. SN-8-1 TaxID=3435409 RepID=UPI003D9A73D1
MGTAMEEAKYLLLQLCDSGFPSGAFSHSFGFETYILEGVIRDGSSFKQWLEAFYKKQWVYNEGFAVRLAYEGIEQGDMEALWDLDRRLTLQTIPREQRLGGIRMGRRMLELVRALLTNGQLELYMQQIEKKKAYGQVPILLALICADHNIPMHDAIMHTAYAAAVSLVQNGVRAIPLGQTEGQRLLYELNPVMAEAARRVNQLSVEDFGISPPGLELASIRHERLEGRMFMS